jgi:glycosyltransferase involved in cell wall biosynthesis
MDSVRGLIVIPCFNESNRFKLDYFRALLKTTDLGYNKNVNIDLLFVDDGSTDNTYNRLEDLLELTNVSILRLSKNVGKANAIRTGFLHAKASKYVFLGYLDSDGAFDVNEVVSCIKLYINSYMDVNVDLLSFARVSLAGSDIRRKGHRHLIGRMISTMLVLGSNYRIYDSQSGFKIYSGKFLSQIDLSSPFKTRWFIDWEIILRSSSLATIVETPVKYWHDVSGSKLSLRHTFLILREILIIKTIQWRS